MKRFIALGFVSMVVACGGSTERSATGGAPGTGGAGVGGGSGGTTTGGVGGTPVGGSGGISSGGVAGTGAAGSGGASGGAGPECTDSSQCKLFSDCCTCMALGPNDPQPPSCLADCTQSACSAAEITSAQCVAGQCVVGYDCTSPVFCNALPPECEPGYVPSVSGGCWGACVKASDCASVNSCADCGKDACVQIDMQGGDAPLQPHCVPVPPECESSTLCGCLGASVCTVPYTACTDLSGIYGVVCGCPNC